MMSQPNAAMPQAETPRQVATWLKALRRRLGLSQSQFARTFALSVGTLQDWEQGRVTPDRAALTLLQVIAHNPEAVKLALRASDGRC